MNFNELTEKIADMLIEHDLSGDMRFEDIEYILQAAAKLGVLDSEVTNNFFDIMEEENEHEPSSTVS